MASGGWKNHSGGLNNEYRSLHLCSRRQDNGFGRLQNDVGRLEHGFGRLDNGCGRLENGFGKVENESGNLQAGFVRLVN